MSSEYYTLKIAGLERKLKKFPVSDKLDIAAFILFGDVELTEHCAKELLKRVPDFDYILTPEAKSIPLAYEMSRLSGKKYIVIRKSIKVYMDNPVEISESSITTKGTQKLYLGHDPLVDSTRKDETAVVVCMFPYQVYPSCRGEEIPAATKKSSEFFRNFRLHCFSVYYYLFTLIQYIFQS